MKNEIISRRKILNNKLKECTNYQYSATLSKTYIGEGFYINHRTKVLKIQPTWGYDIHWAYGGVLKNEVFPLSSKLGEKETELGIYLVSFKSLKAKYKDFYYTLYLNKIEKVKDNRKYIFLTHLDYLIFTDIYELEDCKIEKALYFQEIGKLPIDDIIDKAYIDKQSNKYEKFIFEATYYGLFAKKLYDYETTWEREQFIDAYSETGYDKVRNKQVAIALWQSAYIRYREWKNFIKYIDNIIYMNTDSIYTDKKIDIICKKELGQYDIEYDGLPIQWIRRNAYVVLNKDGSIYKSIIGGVIDGGDMTLEKLETLKKGESVKARTLNLHKEEIIIDLQPQYLLSANGEDLQYKDIL